MRRLVKIPRNQEPTLQTKRGLRGREYCERVGVGHAQLWRRQVLRHSPEEL